MTIVRRTRARSAPTDPINAAVVELCDLSETVLQNNVILPLLEAMGFDHIKDTSGPREKGKDLIALKTTDFGGFDLYAIQIKKTNAVAKSASSQSLGFLVNQLGQTLEEPVMHPITRRMQRPDRALFITPYAVSTRPVEDYAARLRRLRRRGLEVIDGPTLVRLLLQHSPSTLATFTVDIQYRLRVSKDVTTIPEAAAAFGIASAPEFDRIYVDVELTEDLDIDLFDQRVVKTAARVEVATLSKSHLDAFLRDNDLPVSVSKGRPRRSVVGTVTEADISQPLKRLHKRIKEYQSKRQGLAAPECPESVCLAVATQGHTLRTFIRDLRRVHGGEILQKVLAPPVVRVSKTPTVVIPLQNLLKMDRAVLMLGGAGAGKSTAMKWLTRAAAGLQDGWLPIYLPLAGVRNPTTGILLDHASHQLAAFGYYSADQKRRLKALGELLDSGRVRLFLDGLDETGSGANALLAVIQQLSSRYRKSRFIVSCRDTLTLADWDAAFTVRMLPFSDPQIRAFIMRWLKSEAKANGLLKWLGSRPSMWEAARTPLIAALVCNLYDLQADLPTTEVELYKQRFELLLGRWEQAKGQLPLSPDARTAHLRFLQAVAYFLHSNEERTAKPDRVLAIARFFYERAGNVSPAELVEDCIRRDVLARDVEGSIGLGHLTYQEYLTACWLRDRNEAEFLWTRLRTPWWEKVLQFYAAETKDLTGVVKAGRTFSRNGLEVGIVRHLLQYAPYTSKSVVEQLEREPISSKGRDITTVRTPTIELD